MKSKNQNKYRLVVDTRTDPLIATGQIVDMEAKKIVGANYSAPNLPDSVEVMKEAMRGDAKVGRHIDDK